MKRKFICLFAMCFALAANAQVVQGETASGSYKPLAVNAQGYLLAQVVGAAGSGGAVAGNPVRIGLQVRTANFTPQSAGAAIDAISTAVGAQIVRLNSIPELEWYFLNTITTATDTVITGAAGSGTRNYVTGCQIQNSSTTVGMEITLKDGATPIWRGWLKADTSMDIDFNSPLRGSANTALNFGTALAGTVYVNCQGYKAP